MFLVQIYEIQLYTPMFTKCLVHMPVDVVDVVERPGTRTSRQKNSNPILISMHEIGEDKKI